MASPLLETKLFMPSLRRALVPRPRLSERLSRGAQAKLTLISAPTGFGKTTLLAEWLATAAADTVRGVAVSRGERQPARVVIFVWELAVGIYMVVKGFRPSPITAIPASAGA